MQHGPKTIGQFFSWFLDSFSANEQPKQSLVVPHRRREPMDEMLDLASKIAKPFEGLSLTPYHDPVGYPTIGYGRLLSRTKWEPLSKWQPITEEQAEEYLEADMKKAALQAYKLCPPQTTEHWAALTDFCYNCGSGNLEISTLRRRYNRGDIAGARDEFKRWVYAAGIKLNGLIRRRAAEAALMR
jgi:lysozyme